MSDALYIGATGLQAQQLNLDTIANNMVNLSTPAFKKGRVSFVDLVAMGAPRTDPTQAMNFGSEDGLLGSPVRIGAGVGIAHLSKMFDMGDIIQTGSPLDVAIVGDGFLPVAMADGRAGYSRGGTLKVNAEGLLVTQSGAVLKPGFRIPSDATSLSIAKDGTVLVSLPGQVRPVQIGQLQIVRFSDPSSLLAQGGNLYVASPESGEPITGYAGQDGLGTLQPGVLEGSNVKMVDEMVNLMIAQRSYQASVKVVQASDELMGLINNLRK